MMQYLRKSSQSWVMRIFLFILALGFVSFFGGNIGQFWGAGRDPVALTIGSQKILSSEIIQRMQRIAANKLPPGTDLTPYKDMLKQQVISQVVTETLLDLEVERLGLVVGDAQVSRAIQNLEPFQDRDGDFDKLQYEAFLRGTKTSESEFVETMRRELQRQQLIQTMTSGVVAPQTMVVPLLAWVDEKRDIELLEVIANEIAMPLPTAAQIETFYMENPKLFTAPEHRQVSLIALTLEGIMAQTKLTSEEIAEGFKAHRREFKGPLPTKAEEDKIKQELIQEKAEKRFHGLVTLIQDDISGDSPLPEIGKTYELPMVELSRVQANSTFQPVPGSPPLDQTLIKDVVAQAFETNVDDYINLVETDTGAFLALKVEAITPATVKPLAEVHNEVIKYWQQNEQIEAAVKLSKNIVKTPQAQQGLPSFAQDKALRHKDSITLARGTDEHKDLISSKLRHEIFAIEINSVVKGDTADGVVIARLIKVQRDKDPASKEKIENFTKRIHIQLQDDVLNEYLFALDHQYKVNPNQKALDAI